MSIFRLYERLEAKERRRRAIIRTVFAVLTVGLFCVACIALAESAPWRPFFVSGAMPPATDGARLDVIMELVASMQRLFATTLLFALGVGAGIGWALFEQRTEARDTLMVIARLEEVTRLRAKSAEPAELDIAATLADLREVLEGMTPRRETIN